MTKDRIEFVCYHYKYTNGECTLFLFYPNGEWDEDKLTIEEAVAKYPPYKYNWIHHDDSGL